MKKYIFMILSLLVVWACNKEEIQTYDSSYDGVRFSNRYISGFGYISSEGYYKSFSFLDYADSSWCTVDLELSLTGLTADHDREVGYSVDTSTTAPAESYSIVSSVIPADSSNGYIRVRIKNDEALEEMDFKLVINLNGSGDLPVSSDDLADTQATLVWTNQIPFPTASNNTRSYNMLIYGMRSAVSTSKACLSSNAMKAIYAATGWNDWDSYEIHGSLYNSNGYKYLPKFTVLYSTGSYTAYQALIADYLDRYEEIHGERLLHNGGSLEGQPVTARKGLTGKYE